LSTDAGLGLPARSIGGRKRVIFLNRFFFPDHSATSQILSDLAFHLAASGINTHVITSRQLYDEPNARLSAEEAVHDVHIHRVSTTQFGRAALLGRSIDYFSYYASTTRSLFALARRDDIVVAMTDPPLMSAFAMRAVRRREANLVNWLQDLYPEVAMNLNVPFLNGPVGKMILMLRDRSLKAAKANIVVGSEMVSKITSRRIIPNQVYFIPNWANDADIKPVSHADNPLRSKWQLRDKFVIAYSGNLGRAHEFDTILAASHQLKDHPRIVFVCIGGGHRFNDLRQRIEERGLCRTFRFFPYQHRNMLRYSLGIGDVHWISLKPELEGLIFPSKFYGVAAAGRPIIAISAEDGEIAQLINEHGCGIVVNPGDGKTLARTLIHLSTDNERIAEMGRRARAMLETHFSRRHAFERWQALLESL
jgi:glycosyltransferase involved in cell wall biosynthesis